MNNYKIGEFCECEVINTVEIYPDIIFMENVVMNYFILLVATKLSKSSVRHLRLFIGATVGAIYVLVMIFMPGVKVYYSATSKILLSLLIVAISFYPRGIREFITKTIIFYISSFMFAGATFALMYFNRSGGIVKNGVVVAFGERNWTILVLATGLVGIAVMVIRELLQNRLIKGELIEHVLIAFEERHIDVHALIDTGNSLHDPLSNLPVVIVEFSVIRDILPVEIKGIFEQARENDLVNVTTVISQSSWFSRFRLIPFTSLGKENGMLIGFKPDYIQIGNEPSSKGISDVIIGIYNKALSKSSQYNALLNPELV